MWQKLVYSHRRRTFITIGALLVISYIGFNTMRVIGRNYELQRQVDGMQQKIELLKLENQELEYRIAYFRTDNFVDKAARDKLNLQAPGEHVVIFPDKIPQGVSIPKVENQAQSFKTKALSNLDQWLYFLFKKQPPS